MGEHVDVELGDVETAVGPRSQFSVRRGRAGLGVFARRRIPARSVVTWYAGRYVWGEERREISASHLRTVLHGMLAIDGLRAARRGAGAGSLVNAARRPERVNAEYRVDDVRLRVAIVARRDIEAGEEVLVSYGRDYWRRSDEECIDL